MMPRTAGKQPKPKTDCLTWTELLLKVTNEYKVKCACKSVKRLEIIPIKREATLVASVRHFGYSRSSGLAPGRVYFDDVTVFR